MATDAENLRTARSNFIAKLAEVSASPKPSYIVNGQQFSWTEFYTFLTQQIAQIDNLIAAEDGPYEVQVEGVV